MPNFLLIASTAAGKRKLRPREDRVAPNQAIRRRRAQ